MSLESREQSDSYPQQFGKYELVERLAIGGMAEIYRAKTTGLGGFEKFLVIKKLHDRLSADDEFVDMIVDEAKIAVRLNHPNVAKVFDLGRIQDQYYIAMEYIEGPDLNRVFRHVDGDIDKIPVPAALYLTAECCAGLHYAHTRRDAQGRPLGIVHRDVSPPNIMLGLEGEVKLVDFGIAKARKRVQETEHGKIKGKFHYMAPEQARGDHVDPRTDVFSMGMVLYEMLAGANPYDGVEEPKLLDAVQAAEIEPIREHRPAIDPELDETVMRALRHDPNDRYRNAAEFERTLTDYRERKCDPYDRRRLSDLVRGFWEEMEEGGESRPPESGSSDERSRMTPHEFEAGKSSIIYDPGQGHALNEDEGLSGDSDVEGDNPFNDEAPTKIWDGALDEAAAARSEPSTPSEARTREQPAVEPGASETAAPTEALAVPPYSDDESEQEEEKAEGKSAKEESAEKEKSAESRRARLEEAGATPASSRADSSSESKLGTSVIVAAVTAVSVMVVAGVGYGIYSAVVGDGTGGDAAAASEESTESSGAEDDETKEKDEASVDIRVSTKPVGAEVILDGESKGESPLSLNALDPEEAYELEIQREGYASVTREFTPSEQSEPIEIELEKTGGVLRISTYPSDAEVELDGETVGYSPVTVNEVERGETHELVARVDGRKVEREVSWEEGEDPVKKVRLEFGAGEEDEEGEDAGSTEEESQEDQVAEEEGADEEEESSSDQKEVAAASDKGTNSEPESSPEPEPEPEPKPEPEPSSSSSSSSTGSQPTRTASNRGGGSERDQEDDEEEEEEEVDTDLFGSSSSDEEEEEDEEATDLNILGSDD